eukprot:scaffold170854_cov20-Cyclotella_meneghiniana.AAC.1
MSRKRDRNNAQPRGQCVSCSARLFNQSYATFLTAPATEVTGECSHNVCFVCFGATQASRDSSCVSCPGDGCDLQATSWLVHQFANTRHRDPITQNLQEPVVEEEVIEEPNPINQPIEYFRSRPERYRKERCLITFSLASPDDSSKTRTFTATLREDGMTDAVNRAAFASIGKSLHPFLLKTETFRQRPVHSSYVNEDSVADLERDDHSLLRRFVHGISIGQDMKLRDPGE